MDQIEAAQCVVVGGKTFGPLAQGVQQLARTHVWRDPGDNSMNDPILLFEQFVGGSLHRLAPDAGARLHVVQPHQNAHQSR
jgi:hypothetical protein